MEINRVTDHIVVTTQNKRFVIWWNPKYKFGENLVKRFFERITVDEVKTLDAAIKIMNRAIETKQKSLVEGDRITCENADKVVARIVWLQAQSFFAKLDVDKLKEFIECCRPGSYEFGLKHYNKLYDRRFEGVETPLDRQQNECSCLEDWVLTRALIARFFMNDVASAWRFFMVDKAKEVVSDVMKNSIALKTQSFFIQLFMETPYISNMDTRGYDKPEAQRCLKLINEIFSSRNQYSKEIIEGEEVSQYTKMRKKVAQLHDVINGYFKPYRSIIQPRKDFCFMSNEERRNKVIKLFEYWDANVPDDIAYFKEQDELSKLIEKQKQELIDKSDIEYTGKTQEQWKKDQPNLEMEIKNEDGKVIHTEQI